MAQGKLYKHFLRYYDYDIADYQYYYLDPSGNVDITTTETELDYAPEGWQEYEIAWERGFEYLGLFTNISTPLKFFNDSAKILRHLFYTYGIEANVNLYVEMFDESDYTYSILFETAVDFSQFNDEFDNVVVNLIEYGFPAKLKAREMTPYYVDVEENADVTYIKMDGHYLQGKIYWTGIFDEDVNTTPTLAYTYTEGHNIVLHPQSQDTFGSQIKYMYNDSGSTISVTMNLVYSLDIDHSLVGVNANMEFRFIVYNTTTGIDLTTDTITDATTISSLLTNIAGNETITFDVPDGHSVLVKFFLVTLPPTAPGTISDGSYTCHVNTLGLSCYLDNKFETTYSPCIPAKTVFESLVTQIGDNFGTSVVSQLMDTTLNDEIFFTCGDSLRNLGKSSLKITFKEFFEFFRFHFGAAFYYDYDTDACYIEAASNVFNNLAHTTIPSVGEAKSVKVIAFTSESCSTLKIGSNTNTYDQSKGDDSEVSNGKDEFNQEVTRLTPLTRVTTTKSFVSGLRCDMYGIEFERINSSNKEITDRDNDNDVFVLHAEAAVGGSFVQESTGLTLDYHDLYRTAINPTAGASYWEIQNVHSPETAYNIIFSPLRSLLNCGAWFRSLFYMQDTSPLVYQVSGKYKYNLERMITRQGSPVIELNEAANVTISDLCADDEVYFQPYILEIEIIKNINLYQLIGDDRYKFITFTFNGNEFGGFIISASVNPSYSSSCKLRLLPTIDTDLTTLIR